ncbi:PaaI family thioesterase [Anaerobaca lacustris]|uniref:Acyl-coenzyme A thioesterase THEM4 n=1 Tax=Anaerobaca lacustris TaxID=3044600 RepID=A0AAW6TUJ9_9BACT|nr:PaaI family thioesterase [Sedimentisphaerales bacterium M17dextr]
MSAGTAAGREHNHCLICGKRNPWSLGLQFRADATGQVRAHFQAHRRLQGYDGILHGGVIASLLDAAMTHCLFHRDVRAVTGDLHIRFVQPISCSARVEIRAQVVLAKSPLYRLRAELCCAGRVMAWAEAKFLQHHAGDSESEIET